MNFIFNMSPKSILYHSASKYKLTLILALIIALTATQHFAEACSSRTVPKPRPSTSSSSSISATATPTTAAPTTTTTTTTTTPRPNITFPTYKCPATYDAWYCLNEATCFSVKIGESIMFNCECANGFMGPRCEYKELDGSYLPKRPRPMLEKASIASGAICALLFMLFVCLTLYLRYDQRTKTIEFDDDDDGEVSACPYCSDQRCCGSDSADLIGGNTTKKNRLGGALRQHIETFPISFAIKRTTKW